MLKRILYGIILILMSARAGVPQPASITPGIEWLIANQNADKSWGGVSSSATPFNTTAASVSTLRICGNTGSAAVDGLNWLNGQTVDSVNFAADRLLTSAIAGLDTTSDRSKIVAWKNNIEGSWGLDGEYANDIIEIAFALQALKAANYSDATVLYQAINFLTTNQHSDGGWGFTSSDSSNTYVTAMVLRSLSGYSSQFSVQSSINNAAAFLLAKQTQNNDGGFGSSPSTVYETALSVVLATSL
ncbi:MAG: terpene cyclase/mutase family protein [Syntrophaceae bacterium]|nr:terpene cyclase/mutase family protein [Syntrophaceae bacterium]